MAFEWAEAGRASVSGAGGLAVWVQGGDPALCPTLGAAGPGRGFLALSGCTVHCGSSGPGQAVLGQLGLYQ